MLATALLAAPLPARADDGDIALYRDVAAEVEGGAGYYEAVATLHRRENYPLKPFVTVRSPILAYGHARLGATAMLAAAWLLLGLILAAWFRALRDRPVHVRAAVLASIAAVGGAIISPGNLFIHELWSGMLVSLALGLGWDRRLQLVAATLAVLTRELAAPILVLLLFPLERTQTRRVALAAAAVAAFYLWHMAQVGQVLVPGDKHSQGWLGLIGPSGLGGFLSSMTGRDIGLGAAVLPLMGFIVARQWHTLAWCVGVTGAICVLARPDNLFWIMMMFPIYLTGLAFLGAFAFAEFGRIGHSRPAALTGERHWP